MTPIGTVPAVPAVPEPALTWENCPDLGGHLPDACPRAGIYQGKRPETICAGLTHTNTPGLPRSCLSVAHSGSLYGALSAAPKYPALNRSIVREALSMRLRVPSTAPESRLTLTNTNGDDR